MKTQYYTASTLDGFIAGSDHDLDWLLQFGDEGPDYHAFYSNVGALAMGSGTYEWLLGYLKPGTPEAKPWPYAEPCWVFSSRELPAIPGAPIEFVRGDVRPVHERMRVAAGGKNVWLLGGGDLVGQFHDAGLLDEIIVTITSVTLGAGKPLLPRRIATPPLALVSATVYGKAFVQLRYEVPKAPAPR